MASDKKCCVPGCFDHISSRSRPALHLFPDPTKDLERFNMWVSSIGGPNLFGLTNTHIHKYRRVCNVHFERKFCCRYNRLSNIAVPTLYLDPVVVNMSSPVSSERMLSEFNWNVPSTSNAPFIDITSSVLNVPKSSAINMKNESSTSKGVKVKKCTILRATTLVEKILYKKLSATRVKLSKLKNEMKIQKASVKAAENIISNPKFLKALEHLPTAGKIITMLQLREYKKKDKGRRFKIQEKIVSLSIYKQSPKAYRLLRRMFVLPAPQTLIKLINEANINPGINASIFRQLKKQGEKMKPTEKLCLLLFDEMSLKAHLSYNERTDRVAGFVTNGEETWKEFADHVQVFMIRGLIKNYKQPIGFTFSAAATKGPELAKQIKMYIGKLNQTGFIVVATICDQGAGNRSAIKCLVQDYRATCLKKNVEPKDNLFLIDEMEIVPMYDPPHLMKCVRNNFITKNLVYGDEKKVAKWSHLEALYQENPGYQGIRLMPKLTEYHVVPAKICKMKVKYATQIFSRTVAINMGYLADKHILPEECKVTADVLLFFDTLFDSINGSYNKKHRYAKPALGPVTPKSVHHKIWAEAKLMLNKMKFINKNGKTEYVPSLINWAWTLDAIIVLTKELEVEHGVNSIWMRHLNQDPLENFFGTIRSHGARNTNPTPDRFQSAFTSLLINNMSGVHAPGANCENDFAVRLHSLVIDNDCNATVTERLDMDLSDLEIEINDINLKLNNVSRKAALEYCSGYFANIAKKTIFKNCENCKNYFISIQEAEYIKYREFSTKRWLCSPTFALMKIISEMQDIIYELLKKYIMKQCLKQYIKTVIFMSIDFSMVKCETHRKKILDCLINCTINFFIHTYCKNINKILCGRRSVDDDADMLQIKAKNHFVKCHKRNK